MHKYLLLIIFLFCFAYTACNKVHDEVDSAAAKLLFSDVHPIVKTIQPDTVSKLTFENLKSTKIASPDVSILPKMSDSCSLLFKRITNSQKLLVKNEFSTLNNYDSLLLFKNQKTNLKPFESKNPLFGEQQAIKIINGADNLPGSTVNCFYQDKYNRLWIGTDGGLAIFNGFNFEIITSENGLSHNYINCIAQGEGDTIFVGTKGGIDLFCNNKHASILPSHFGKDAFSEVNCLFQIKNILLVGTSKGLLLLKGKQYLMLTIKDGLAGEQFKDFEKISETKIALASLDGGLMEIDFLPEITITNRFQSLSINCIKKGDQQIYLGTANQGIWMLRNDSLFTFYSSQQDISTLSVFDIHHNKHKLTLASFGKGTYWIENGQLINLNKIEPSLTPFANALIESNNGDLLIGGADGIFKLAAKFSYLSKKNGLSSSIPISCAFDSLDQLWVSTINRGLSIFSKNKINYLTKKSGLHSNNIMQVLHSKSGKTLLATSGNGVDILYKNNLYNLGKTSGLNIVNANCILEDKELNIWIGTNENGLYKWDGKVLLNYGPKQGITSNCIYGLNTDADNNLLIGTNGDGFMILKNDTNLLIYNKTNGLKNNVVYSSVSVAKDIFFGTYGGGLHWLKAENKLSTISPQHGLTDPSILSLAFDSLQNLYCATAKGLSIINLFTAPMQITNYSINEGLLADDFFPNAVARNSRNGKVAWGCNKYLLSSNSTYLNSSDSVNPWLVCIEFGDNQNAENNFQWHAGKQLQPVEINFNDNAFKFVPGYGGNWFAKKEQAIKYKLIGFDKNWIYKNSVAKTDGIVYNNLAPGSYVLLYSVQQSNGIWSKPISFKFEILPPWYRTVIAYVFYTLLFIASLWGFAQVRNKQLIKKNQLLEGVVIERTKEIVEQKVEIEKSKELVELKNHELTEKNHEIVQSITYAKRLQEAILPNKSLIDEYLLDYFLIYLPKDIVAGDFYWFEPIQTNNNKLLFFAVADCTGHGVPGAMVSVVCSTALNRSLQEFTIYDTGKLLDKTRDLVIETFQKSEDEVKDGMDISLCCLNTDSLELTWSGANNPIYIIKNLTKELIEIKANKQPIGKYLEPTPFKTHYVKLEKGDSIYIFSDGYADQFGGESGKKFKSSNLKALFISVSEQPMQLQKNSVLNAFENWKGSTEQIDDVCVWGVKV